MPRFHKTANDFSKISLAHAQATGRRENAVRILLIWALHEAIRAHLGSVFEFAKA